MPIKTGLPFNYYFADQAEGLEAADTLSKILPIDTIPSTSLPEGIAIGLRFGITVFDTVHYLKWLQHRFIKRGGHIHRAKLSTIYEAFDVRAERASLVVNCSGSGAKELGGVEDANMEPVLGHSVVVHAPWLSEASQFCLTDGNRIDIMPRPSGNVALVNSRIQRKRWVSVALFASCLIGYCRYSSDAELNQATLAAAVAACPALLPPDQLISDLRIISSGWGQRPVRKCSMRIELQQTDDGQRLYIWVYLIWY